MPSLASSDAWESWRLSSARSLPGRVNWRGRLKTSTTRIQGLDSKWSSSKRSSKSKLLAETIQGKSNPRRVHQP